MDIKDIKEFFIIEKQEFSYFSQKMQNKKYKFYTKDIMPPTHKDVLGLERFKSEHGVDIGLRQNEIPEDVKVRFKENIALQSEILRIVMKRINSFNYKCGIIKAKTGVGKTHVCMDIITKLQHVTLILVSNKKLMQEMVDKIGQFMNYKPMQYGGGKKEVGFITVMTKKSFTLDYKKVDFSDFDLVLIDECHQGFTKKFRDCFNISFANRDLFIYGLSATPSTNELDEEDLEKYYGKIIDVKRCYDFIPRFTFHNYISGLNYEFEHYAELKQQLVDDEERHEEQRQVILDNLSTKCSLILCDRLEEIQKWTDYMFEISHTYYNVKITGETKIEDDKKNLNTALETGKPIVIIGSTQKCSTGFDFPIIDTVFIFSSIKFENTVIQSIGRALRKSPGKQGAKIHVWNDKILDKQRVQKQRAVYEEYGITNKEIQNIYIDKKFKQKGNVALIF